MRDKVVKFASKEIRIEEKRIGELEKLSLNCFLNLKAISRK